jgi:hypothetical protein
MRRTFGRGHHSEPTTERRPTVGTRALQSRTDLTCSVCTHVIAYNVRPERVLADAGFFLEAHKPFCSGMRAAG